MERSIDEARQRLEAIKTTQDELATERRTLERDLRRDTAVAWVGEINRDDEGDYVGYLTPVSIEVKDERYRVNGDAIWMAFSRGHNYVSVTLIIDGDEAANCCIDGSGSSKYRAFRDRDAAVQWVERKAKIQYP